MCNMCKGIGYTVNVLTLETEFCVCMEKEIKIDYLREDPEDEDPKELNFD